MSKAATVVTHIDSLDEHTKKTLPNVVLVLTGAYLPGYRAGGPVRSISNLVAALGGELQFRIVTLDRDHRAKSPYPSVVTNQWVPVGNADVMYLRPGLRGFLNTWTLLRSVDGNTVLYLNSFFSRRFSMLPVFMRWLKLCRPRSLLLAPRGEFSLGALHLKSMRKRVYIRISRWLGLYKSVIWHASSEFEAEDIRRKIPAMNVISIAGVIPELDASLVRHESIVVTASDISEPASLRPRGRSAKRPGQLRAVSVSRVARMKNLAGALRMLDDLSGDVSFDIYGPKEDVKYWNECQEVIAALPPNIRVRYKGEIEHEMVANVLARYDLFLFPTLGENYGHVISEALASGCPVLISDQTPWRNLEADGIGWDIPLGETERFRSVLQQCVDSDAEWFMALSKRAMDYAAKRASAPETIDANRELFQSAFAWHDAR